MRGGGRDMRTDIRNNDRVAFDDLGGADALWGRVQPVIPTTLAGGTAVGLDEHFRVYRYDPSQRFKTHKDGVVVRSPTVRSRLTCMVYLNDDFTGGETAFYAYERVEGDRPVVAEVHPRTGMGLVFLHEWWHEGKAVLSGRKYVLRTDVFYRFPADS
jgi:hypothetical protein